MNSLTSRRLHSHQVNRAVGTIIGLAAGDALGAPFEFGPALSPDTELGMVGGGAFDWEPGEWTDDTSMAIPIAQLIAAGRDLTHPDTLTLLVRSWIDWADAAPDVGAQTRAVLGSLSRDTATAQSATDAAARLHAVSGRTAGNGALMRTAPVALAYVNNTDGLTEAAIAIAKLTHADESAGEACVIWCHAIVHAIHTGDLSLEPGLQQLSPARQDYWRPLIDEAESHDPSHFTRSNGWVVSALQGAWSAIVHGLAAGEGFVGMVERAVRGGGDADTVAAIAGSLAGASCGVSAIPAAWRESLHGWPGYNYRDLVRLACNCIQFETPHGWPNVDVVEYPGAPTVLRPHPHDEGVLLGTVPVLKDLPSEVDAVVSLCLTGSRQLSRNVPWVDFWLIDNDGSNLNLEFMFADIADTIARWRAAGKTVLLHCVAAQSRTTNAAVAYSVRHCDITLEQAIRDVDAVTPIHGNTIELPAAVARVTPPDVREEF